MELPFAVKLRKKRETAKPDTQTGITPETNRRISLRNRNGQPLQTEDEPSRTPPADDTPTVRRRRTRGRKAESPRPDSSSLDRHGVDLDARTHRQTRHLVTDARRQRAGEIGGVNAVHRGEIPDVLQQDGGLHHIRQRIPRLGENGRNVLEPAASAPRCPRPSGPSRRRWATVPIHTMWYPRRSPANRGRRPWGPAAKQ